jgi:hypothetical protein
MDRNSNIFSVSNEPERNNEKNVLRHLWWIFFEFPVQLVDCMFAGTRSCKFPVKLVNCMFAGTRSCEFPVNWLIASLQERVPVNFPSNWSTASLQERVPVNFTTKGVQIKFTFTEGPNQNHRKELLWNSSSQSSVSTMLWSIIRGKILTGIQTFHVHNFHLHLYDCRQQ